ncbi:MAG: hypothetical protein HUK20_11245 [Fibrobacter sp.]|nr:hypothetical protein [Fibrobacter sp.]
MSEIHIECPHCGKSFDVALNGEPSNMMVFCCACCKTPLMYYHGEISEMDKEEYAGLRQKLSKVLDAMVRNDGSVGEVASALKKMIEVPTLSDETLDALQKELDVLDADAFLDKI